jgi:hypothetical protein
MLAHAYAGGDVKPPLTVGTVIDGVCAVTARGGFFESESLLFLQTVTAETTMTASKSPVTRTDF